jgi:hypothetical protein
MCDAVVPVRRPEKLVCICMVPATVSILTLENPVPGDAFEGDSFGPLRVAVNVIGSALRGIE